MIRYLLLAPVFIAILIVFTGCNGSGSHTEELISDKPSNKIKQETNALETEGQDKQPSKKEDKVDSVAYDSLVVIEDPDTIEWDSTWQDIKMPELGLQVKLPPKWRYAAGENVYTGIFGADPDSANQLIWGIYQYDLKKEAERNAAMLGEQFDDRILVKKIVKADSMDYVVYTAISHKNNWSYKMVIVEIKNKLYGIEGGNADDEEFKKFYRSLKALDTTSSVHNSDK